MNRVNISFFCFAFFLISALVSGQSLKNYQKNKDAKAETKESKNIAYPEKYLTDFLNRKVAHKKYRDKFIAGWLGATLAISIQEKNTNSSTYFDGYQIKGFERNQVNKGLNSALFQTASAHLKMAGFDLGQNANLIDKAFANNSFLGTNNFKASLKTSPLLNGSPQRGILLKGSIPNSIESIFTVGIMGALAPGMPQAAAELALRVGGLTYTNEELQAGILAAVFLAESYSADSVFQAFKSSLSILPNNSPLLKPLVEIGNLCNQSQDSSLLIGKWLEIRKDNSNILSREQFTIFNWMGSNIVALSIAHKNFVKALKICSELMPDDKDAFAFTGFLAGNEAGLIAFPDSLMNQLDRDRVFIPEWGWNFDSLTANTEKVAWQVHGIAGSYIELVGFAKVMKMPDKAAGAFPLLKDYTPEANCTVNVNSVNEYIADISAIIPNGYKALWLMGNFKTESGAKLNYLYSKSGEWKGTLLVYNEKGSFNFCHFQVKTAPDYFQTKEVRFVSKNIKTS